jgi:hypothetical protein
MKHTKKYGISGEIYFLVMRITKTHCLLYGKAREWGWGGGGL